MPATPSDINEAIALADRMASNPADAVSMADMLVSVIERLPPEAATLLSRPLFQRASLWSLGVSFENVLPNGEAPPQTILCQHDVWIRGVSICVIPLIHLTGEPTLNDLIARLLLFRNACATQGTNNRGLVEANWRVDASQGFISEGQAEITGPGTLIAGDGFWSAPLDWRLQKDQTIEVRLRSRMNQFFPLTLGANMTDAERVLRWVTVVFWAEELRQPSVR